MISKENQQILKLFYKNKEDFKDFLKLHDYAINSGIEDIFISLNIVITHRTLKYNSSDSDGSFDHTSIILNCPMDLPNPKDMTITLVHELGHYLEEKVTPLKTTNEAQRLRDKDHWGTITNNK